MARRSKLDSREAQEVIVPILERNPRASCRQIQAALEDVGIKLSHTTVNDWLKKRRNEVIRAVRTELTTAGEAENLGAAGEALGHSLAEDIKWIDERLKALDEQYQAVAGTKTKTAEEIRCRITDTQRRLLEARLKLMSLTPAPDVIEFADKVARAVDRVIRRLPEELQDQVRAAFETELNRAGFFEVKRD